MGQNVFVGTFNMRGKWAKKPHPNAIVLNVTSVQGTSSVLRTTFSPMTNRQYKGFACFQNYWQSGKVWDEDQPQIAKKWWRAQTKGKRRYPPSKGKQYKYIEHQDGKRRNYLQARKQVYVPQYFQLIKESPVLKEWMEKAKHYMIVVFDLDGPRGQDNSPLCLKLTKDLLKSKVNDPTKPFGHGYIVAGLLAGFTPDQYLS